MKLLLAARLLAGLFVACSLFAPRAFAPSVDSLGSLDAVYAASTMPLGPRVAVTTPQGVRQILLRDSSDFSNLDNWSTDGYGYISTNEATPASVAATSTTACTSVSMHQFMGTSNWHRLQ